MNLSHFFRAPMDAPAGRAFLAAVEHDLGQPFRVLLGETQTAPYTADTGAQSLAITNAAILGQLFEISPHFELRLGQIEPWKWESGTSSYRLKLKSGLKFHSGRPVNARDLEFSLLRGFFSKRRSFYQVYVGTIAGTDKVPDGTPFKSGAVEGIEALNDLEIRVRLGRPNPAFLYSLVNPFLALVPQAETCFPAAIRDQPSGTLHPLRARRST